MFNKTYSDANLNFQNYFKLIEVKTNSQRSDLKKKNDIYDGNAMEHCKRLIVNGEFNSSMCEYIITVLMKHPVLCKSNNQFLAGFVPLFVNLFSWLKFLLLYKSLSRRLSKKAKDISFSCCMKQFQTFVSRR